MKKGLRITLKIVLPLVILLIFYETNEKFHDTISDIRTAVRTKIYRRNFNKATKSVEYQLVNAYPKVELLTPIDFQFDLEDNQNVYVLGRNGLVFKVTPTGKELVLDLSDAVNFEVHSENGALGFALHPQYAQNKKIFIYYSNADSNTQKIKNYLVSFDLSATSLKTRRASEQKLISVKGHVRHNGGSVDFCSDGFLYLSLGDFDQEGYSQQIDRTLSSGIFRIDVDKRGGNISHPIRKQPANGRTQHYFIPNDNPFNGVEGALEEFYALGLRNTFRFGLDLQTGDIWGGDVGGSKAEELNRIQKGGNYQWNVIEGVSLDGKKIPNQVIGSWSPPVHTYKRQRLNRSIMGGFVYRGDKFPQLRNHVIFAENFAGYIAMIPADTKATVTNHIQLATCQSIHVNGITTLRESSEGEIFVGVLGDSESPTGKIYRLAKKSKNQTRQADEPSVIQSGEALYHQYCVSCHGKNGEGKGFVKTAVPAPNFRPLAWWEKRSDKELERIITQGGEKNGLSSAMPAWGQTLNPKQVKRLIEYLRQFSK